MSATTQDSRALLVGSWHSGKGWAQGKSGDLIVKLIPILGNDKCLVRIVGGAPTTHYTLHIGPHVVKLTPDSDRPDYALVPLDPITDLLIGKHHLSLVIAA